MKLNKKELLEKMAAQTHQMGVSTLSQAECGVAMDALVRVIISETMSNDTTVSVAGLGTFAPVHKKARTARNPHTGEAVEVPAKTVVKFKASSSLTRIEH